MIRLCADENFNRKIVEGVLQRRPDLNIVQLRETALLGAEDPLILEWAAQQGRILLTHDIQTMVGFAYARIAQGLPMSGVFAVSSTAPIGLVIEHLLIALESTLRDDEWEDQVVHFPL